jgi:CBS domain-containing protein
VTIEPSASLADAANLLAEKRIGAVLVLGADVLGEPVSVAMTRKVSTCNETELISNVMERMTAGKFRHMPVIDQGQPVGMISIGDAVKYRLQAMERDSAAMREYISTT